METQLKNHVLEATSRWGFDFSAGQPIRSPEAKYTWERVPPLDDEDQFLSQCRGGPGPVMTLSSAAHVRTIDVVAMSPSSTASTLSSANCSLQSSPSTSVCNSDLDSDLDLSAVHGDLNDNGSKDGVAAKKRMVQKKMTGEFPLFWGAFADRRSVLNLRCGFDDAGHYSISSSGTLGVATTNRHFGEPH